MFGKPEKKPSVGLAGVHYNKIELSKQKLVYNNDEQRTLSTFSIFIKMIFFNIVFGVSDSN